MVDEQRYIHSQQNNFGCQREWEKWADIAGLPEKMIFVIVIVLMLLFLREEEIA